MRKCLATMLLACFAVVYGCSTPSGNPEAEAPESTATAETTSEGGTPQTAADVGDAEMTEGTTTADTTTEGTTTPKTADTNDGGAEATTVAAEGATSDGGGTAPANAGTSAVGTDVADATPVGASVAENSGASLARPQAALVTPGLANESAPGVYKVKFTTTAGDFVIEAHRDWAPNGADRLYNLVKIGFFTDVSFFRVMKNFVVQFGIHGDPEVSAAWLEATIEDDAVQQSNTRGFVSFADRRSPNTRTTQLFINLASMNSYLDEEGYAPVATVVEGMDVVESLYSGYGDGAPRGSGPSQSTIQLEGNEYLKRDFPKLDYIKSASIIE